MKLDAFVRSIINCCCVNLEKGHGTLETHVEILARALTREREISLAANHHGAILSRTLAVRSAISVGPGESRASGKYRFAIRAFLDGRCARYVCRRFDRGGSENPKERKVGNLWM